VTRNRITAGLDVACPETSTITLRAWLIRRHDRPTFTHGWDEPGGTFDHVPPGPAPRCRSSPVGTCTAPCPRPPAPTRTPPAVPELHPCHCRPSCVASGVACWQAAPECGTRRQLHGVATLTRARRLRPDYHQARLTMLVDQLAGVPGW